MVFASTHLFSADHPTACAPGGPATPPLDPAARATSIVAMLLQRPYLFIFSVLSCYYQNN